jgi:hypothetical protein
MATAPSSRLLAAAALVALLALAGCGRGAARPGGGRASGTPAPFAWLRPAAAPADWKTGRPPSRTADVGYPPGWRSIRTDPGSFSAALMGAHDRIRGYLNATRRSGAETLANWNRFRPAHNTEEGDRNVISEASATGLRFRSGTGSCVIDRYATTTNARYREIACIVRGARGTTVVVAAARAADWTRLAPQLERAVGSFST